MFWKRTKLGIPRGRSQHLVGGGATNLGDTLESKAHEMNFFFPLICGKLSEATEVRYWPETLVKKIFLRSLIISL